MSWLVAARPAVVGWLPAYTIVGACCDACAKGKTCEGSSCAIGAQRASVGRSQPNSEIADHEAHVTQLKADIGAHEPKGGDGLELSNWAKLNHIMNGYLLRWGQWKTALESDWWWGDDDEQAFAALKAEYNKIRDQYLEYTSGKTSAPPATVVSETLKEQEKEEAEQGSAGQQLLDTVKVLLVLGGVAATLYFVGPALLGAWFTRAATAATP